MKTLTKTFARRVISALLVTIMVFSLGITSIVSTSAAETELAETSIDFTGGEFYFNNINSKWNYSYFYLCLGNNGHTKLVQLTKVTGTQLYYTNDLSYNGADYIAVMARNDSWGSGNFGYPHISGNCPAYTEKVTNYNLNYGNVYIFRADGSTKGTTVSRESYSDWTADQKLNTSHSIYSQLVEGSAITNSTVGGKVTASSYKFTSNTSTQKTSATISQGASSSSASISSGYTASVTLTATPAEGYEFVGWATSSNGAVVNKTNPYTYTYNGVATPYYARFKPLLEVSLDSSQSTALTATVGDTVTIKAAASGATSYSYQLIDAYTGENVGSAQSSGTFTVPCNKEGTFKYKVKVTANGVEKETGEVTVTVGAFPFEVSYTAPESVMTYKNIVISPSSNAPKNATVQYTLKDGDTEINPETSGNFLYTTVAGDSGKTKTFTLTATTTIGEETYTDEETINVLVNPYDLNLTLEASQLEIEGGLNLTLTAKDVFVPQGIIATYNFKNETDDTVLTDNNIGTHTFATSEDDIGRTITYSVTVTATVDGQEYSKTATVAVSITGVKDAYNVKIYFKGSGTLGYRPLITTDGAVEELETADMTRDVYIRSNESQTAHYYWFEKDIEVSKAKPTVQINIESERYHFEGEITLNITDSNTTFYLGVDNLYNGTEMVDMTEWTEAKRTWCENALHMVYDVEEDGEAALEDVETYALTSIGDANGDGNVNIQDATYIQKSLADMLALSEAAAVVSDVTDDGSVNVKDATALQKQLAGL